MVFQGCIFNPLINKDMKTKTVYQVFHTTDNGADYVVKTCNDYLSATKWEFENRHLYIHPLIIRKQTYKY
jgi:hypothetical protein